MSMARAAPLFLLLVAIPVVVSVSDSGEGSLATVKPNLNIYGKVQVDLWNKYPGVMVTAHCKSKDTDFGILGGAPGIDVVSFSFQPNLFMNTLYYCTVWRGSPGQGKVQFTIYSFQRDGNNGRCASQCTWYVRADGIHGVDQSSGNKEDLFFPWGP